LSLARFFRVLRLELATNLKRPMVWFLVAALVFLSWGLASGTARISTGDTSVGGKKAFLTSEFANGTALCIVTFLLYSFFAAVAAGTTILRDDEQKVGEILHSTRLTPREYVWGKFCGVLLVYLFVLALHLVVVMGFNHLLPIDNPAELRGPFLLSAYLRPALAFGLPILFFVLGTSFGLGERTRRPILVFFLPVALMVVCGFFLWDWSPGWLDPRINRALMLIEPSGFRWLNETWLKVDRGVDFYNTQPIRFDVGFVVSRLAFVALGLGAVEWSARRFAATLRGRRRVSRKEAQARASVFLAPATVDASAGGALAALGMKAAAPGFVAATRAVLAAELRELRGQPGLYLFVPLILLQTLGSSLVAVGPFDTPLLITPGNFAVGSMNTLTLLLSLLLMFYTVESLERERGSGLAAIHGSTPVPTAAILTGKSLANSIVAVGVLSGALLGCLIGQAIQGTVPISLSPFVIVWGLLLVPTFLVWTSFIAMVQSATRNRYTSYGIGLAVLCLWGWLQLKGYMNWAGNWDLWSSVVWSDLSILEFDRRALVLNRAYVLGLAALFLTLATWWFPRRDFDAARLYDRFRPQALGRAVLRLAPIAVIPLFFGIYLAASVHNGPGGGVFEKKGKDYWRKNLTTWKDAPTPDLAAVRLELDLYPSTSGFHVRGAYDLVNRGTESLREIPLTIGPHFTNVKFTLDGKDVEPESKTLLRVFAPESPLAPGGGTTIGFEYDGRFPAGISKNGGGEGEFILPSGVVLTSFQPSFAPVLGYIEEVGVDEDNRYEPRSYPPDWYEQTLKPAFGAQAPFTTHISVSGPEELTLNSVGTLVSDTVDNGRRVSVWESDHPVRFFNVVAGKWTVRRGTGTAIYYHAPHDYNLDEMIEALDGARRWYGEWFAPFPWKELKVSEFPGLATYAQGFPTNITFSEGIGFLTESDPRANAAFMVTAHESAHQWWGNLLTPGKGPGGNILSEGMSHFATGLLFEQVKGLQQRIGFFTTIETRYGRARQVDSERPLVKIDGSRAGDTTVTYDRGGWVFYMLYNLMGKDAALAGMREFIAERANGPDYPLIEDLVAVLRKHAPDPAAFDDFTKQWIFGVVVPEYKLADARREGSGGAYTASVRVKNAGTGTMPVEVAAVKGERFDEDGKVKEDYREARARVTLAAGEERAVEIACDFEPDRVLMDPDALVLQLNRNLAVARF